MLRESEPGLTSWAEGMTAACQAGLSEPEPPSVPLGMRLPALEFSAPALEKSPGVLPWDLTSGSGEGLGEPTLNQQIPSDMGVSLLQVCGCPSFRHGGVPPSGMQCPSFRCGGVPPFRYVGVPEAEKDPCRPPARSWSSSQPRGPEFCREPE